MWKHRLVFIGHQRICMLYNCKYFKKSVLLVKLIFIFQRSLWNKRKSIFPIIRLENRQTFLINFSVKIYFLHSKKNETFMTFHRQK